MFYPPPVRLKTIARIVALGVFAMLLAVGCRNDDFYRPVLKPANGLTSDEALARFAKNYKPGKDFFCDRVMELFLKYNNSTPIVPSLVSEYGMPRWDVQRTYSPKSGNLLLVPIEAETPDSLSLMAFIELGDKVWYKHFNPSTPDTLMRDMMYYYRTRLYPKYMNNNILVETSSESSKGDIIEFCYNFYAVAKDGTKTYLYSYCWYYIFNSLEENVIGNDNNFSDDKWTDISGGGGDVPTTPTPTPLPKTDPKVNVIKEKINNTCAGHFINQAVWGNVNFFINSLVGVFGNYDPSTGNITFNGIENLNVSHMLHELFHAYQHHLLGSLPKPGEAGYINLEFEAHLFVDWWAWGRIDDHKSWVTKKDNYNLSIHNEYYEWLNKIIKSPNELKNSAEYMKWLNKFYDYMPDYRSPIDNSRHSIPNQMLDILKKCNQLNN